MQCEPKWQYHGCLHEKLYKRTQGTCTSVHRESVGLKVYTKKVYTLKIF